MSLHQHQWQQLQAFKSTAVAHLAQHATINTLSFSAVNNLCASRQPIQAALMATVETSDGAIEAVLVSTGRLLPCHTNLNNHGRQA